MPSKISLEAKTHAVFILLSHSNGIIGIISPSIQVTQNTFKELQTQTKKRAYKTSNVIISPLPSNQPADCMHTQNSEIVKYSCYNIYLGKY